jgi:hypothetical protein
MRRRRSKSALTNLYLRLGGPRKAMSRSQLMCVNVLKKKSLNKYRRLPIFNRNTGEKEYRDRRIAKNIFRKDQFSPAFSYPSNNNRTRSISRRSFAKQTADLKSSSWFINQFRGGLQDNYGGVSAKVPWASPSTDILAYQARKVLSQEEQERLKPATDFFDSVVNNRTRQNGQSFQTPQGNKPNASLPPTYRTFV